MHINLNIEGGNVSVRVMADVWEMSDSKGTDRLVLLAIADHAHDDGSGAFPSYKLLTKKTRLSERTIRSCIRRLEELGELTVIQTPGRSNSYCVHTPANSAGVSEPDPGEICRTPRQTVAGHPGKQLPPNHKEPSDNPSAAKESPPEPKTKTKTKPRARDAVWDTVVEVCRIDDSALTASSASDLGKTVRELKQVGAEPDEIRARAGRWRSMYPTADLTHRVLRNRWPELSALRTGPTSRGSKPGVEGLSAAARAAWDAEIQAANEEAMQNHQMNRGERVSSG